MWVRSGLLIFGLNAKSPGFSPGALFFVSSSILAGGRELLGNGDVLLNVGDKWNLGLTGFWAGRGLGNDKSKGEVSA